ncbi:ABC transporter permease [Pseudodesulfovibrio piezophilus]|uniref:STAS domain-containing protein n=1 Tax=Pseudodesulfovibrio piezophilus (strain DSM 21447 / JCM 15486 / C1TLV30) TaxID=1322246 RepID=M1WT31_PSEP2|nr:ABC transporter permease [Pseudodesulfovibrio piezophilus]CCH50569.1 conserved membrane protein of unknown function [Pseudodesulfovibrio piezophilus C1TLV30]
MDLSLQQSPLLPDLPGARFEKTTDNRGLKLNLYGLFDATGTAHVWENIMETARKTTHRSITADCSGIVSMDGAGIALLLKIREEAILTGRTFNLLNLKDEYVKLINLTWDCGLPQWEQTEKERRGFVQRVGEAANAILADIHEMVAFVGESSILLGKTALHPQRVRWKDVVISCINIGVDSLFIITLIGFLMGLIMSFQSAISLQQFGGEIFVPNMLGLVMFREMGPLVTSILLAARSGSAFAAEIGTMKINEELDALTTMGLSPMQFMVLPKLISAVAMVPLMTIFFNLASLVGGALVMLSLGFPLVTFSSRIFANLDFLDFWGGMLKAVVFAMLVSGVGCLRGLQTRSGASAVGLSTTSAVVSGIVLIAFADGLFAVAFYYLGW